MTTPALPHPGDFSIGSARGDKFVLLIESFFKAFPPLFIPALSSSLRLDVCLGAMGKRAANDSQCLLISTICSASAPLISEREQQHVEGK